MRNINKYNDFIIDKEFESISNQIFKLLESEEAVTYEWDLKKDKEEEKPVTYEWDLKKDKDSKVEKPVTFEWDLTKPNLSVADKLKNFLSKLPKEKVKEYFLKFLSKLSFLPEITRKKLMVTYAGAFLSVASIAFLTTSSPEVKKEAKLVKEFVKLTKKASFDISQKMVSLAEGDYSDDRKDTGNFVNFELNGKKVKRFIGSKYGISAPILQKYLGKLPKKNDMINLSYETALDIYKNMYWDDQKIDRFCNQSVANVVYDGCVNQGIAGMKDVLRKVIRENGGQISDDDNPFKGDYIKNLNVLDQNKLFSSLKKLREERYREARTFKVHGDGWLDRLSKIEFIE